MRKRNRQIDRLRKREREEQRDRETEKRRDRETDIKHLAGGVKLALIGNNLVNQSGLTFFKVAGTGGIFT